MEKTERITAGTILVCIKTQSTGCGIKYCRKDSIVKCFKEPKDYHTSVLINRNEREAKNDKWFPVDKSNLRIATPEEICLYNKGIYHLNETIEA